MGQLGTLTFQALDNSDVFLTADVFLDGVSEFGDAEIQVPQPGFENDKAYITGSVPKSIPVTVEGDTSLIYGWFKADEFPFPFVIKIYLECEEVEDYKEEKKDERGIHTKDNS